MAGEKTRHFVWKDIEDGAPLQVYSAKDKAPLATFPVTFPEGLPEIVQLHILFARKQKLANDTAAIKTTAEKVTAMLEINARLESGVWSEARTGGGNGAAAWSDLHEAVSRYRKPLPGGGHAPAPGKEATAALFAKYAAAYSPEEFKAVKKKIRENPDIKALLATIAAERAKEAAKAAKAAPAAPLGDFLSELGA
jgi:hypothetical protein